MTNFNRRRFMSLAGIAAAEPAMSLFGSAETSALPEAQTGNGEWTYEVVQGCAGEGKYPAHLEHCALMHFKQQRKVFGHPKHSSMRFLLVG